jgi:hypothetical protein
VKTSTPISPSPQPHQDPHKPPLKPMSFKLNQVIFPIDKVA